MTDIRSNRKAEPYTRVVNLRQLEYVIAIAEEGSFRAAAERAHVTPPSLSEQIRALETELGGPLFERLPRGARPTPAGRALLPEARAAVRAAHRAGHAARAALDLAQAELEIATVFSLAVGLLPGVLDRLSHAHPGITVSLHEFLHRRELVRAVDDGIGDIAVGPMPPARDGPLLELGHESFVAIVGPRHRAFDRRAPVRLDALADDDWVQFPEWHGLHDLVTAICAHAGFTPREAVRTAQVEAAVRLAASGLGVAVVPANIVPLHLSAHVRELEPPVFRLLCAFTRADWSPQAHALLEALEHEPWPDVPRDAFVVP
jgi:DNA-binding transcriptional LysR family regulator